MPDYVRDKEYILTEDGTRLKTDKYGNILRGKNDGFVTEKDEEILMEVDGDKRGQPKDSGKMPKSTEQTRMLG
jgi:hypothetical protein